MFGQCWVGCISAEYDVLHAKPFGCPKYRPDIVGRANVMEDERDAWHVSIVPLAHT